MHVTSLLQSNDKQLEGVDEITKQDSRAFGAIFSSLLEKRYPQLSQDNDWITLDVLLEWVVWPNYLKIMQQGSVAAIIIVSML